MDLSANELATRRNKPDSATSPRLGDENRTHDAGFADLPIATLARQEMPVKGIEPPRPKTLRPKRSAAPVTPHRQLAENVGLDPTRPFRGHRFSGPGRSNYALVLQVGRL